ncbi:LuxR C-terminal-related transcriptional regulator [Streptomyces sp. W16]|uniref:response regulator transcription factor n=1 Tax=Streptomyces sp. W16 TaxID=3076631 RepID=UPI00295B153A|nr:LuxR C-terminal-related transcriptional regulator [Streptomyces sp. W16]MDV9173050.1 LuxR C-terminal-related transcriptional regulator [Streptomyces sp. W16]
MRATTPEVEETDQQILELLYQGLVDAAVARKLGLGHRTVQRRVQNLMELLQVRGRVALGAKAQELGLLPASGSSARRLLCDHE